MVCTVAWRGHGNDVDSGAFVITITQSHFSPINHGVGIFCTHGHGDWVPLKF